MQLSSPLVISTGRIPEFPILAILGWWLDWCLLNLRAERHVSKRFPEWARRWWRRRVVNCFRTHFYRGVRRSKPACFYFGKPCLLYCLYEAVERGENWMEVLSRGVCDRVLRQSAFPLNEFAFFFSFVQGVLWLVCITL